VQDLRRTGASAHSRSSLVVPGLFCFSIHPNQQTNASGSPAAFPFPPKLDQKNLDQRGYAISLDSLLLREDNPPNCASLWEVEYVSPTTTSWPARF
jgi:hypothetical protein